MNIEVWKKGKRLATLNKELLPLMVKGNHIVVDSENNNEQDGGIIVDVNIWYKETHYGDYCRIEVNIE